MTRALQAPPPLRHEIVDQCAEIIYAVDTKARAIERRWGTGVLPRTVPIEMMERFNRQKAKFSDAAFRMDLEDCRKHGAAMERAFAALEDAAAAIGEYPEPAATWEFTLQTGALVILVRDRAELAQVDTGGRAAQVWSLEEIATIVEKFPVLSAAKDSFPGAEIVSLRPAVEVQMIDDVLEETPFYRSLPDGEAGVRS